MPGTAHPLPRSGKFLAPGRPVQPEHLTLVRQALLDSLKALSADHGLHLADGRDRDEHLLSVPGLSLHESCDLAETALKTLLGGLSADLIGGANVTRLDRVLAMDHPRLPYRRALRIVGGRGWHLNLGDDLPPEVQASLIRFCGLLPVQVLYLPAQVQPASRAPATQGFCTLVPWGGQIMQAVLPLAGQAGEAVFSLRGDGLLQFVLGLADPVS